MGRPPLSCSGGEKAGQPGPEPDIGKHKKLPWSRRDQGSFFRSEEHSLTSHLAADLEAAARLL